MRLSKLLNKIKMMGIRTSFLLGFAAVSAVLIVSVVLTVFSMSRINQETQIITTEQLPDTIKILRLAKAADSLITATSPLLSITDRNTLNQAFTRIENAKIELRTALREFNITSSEGKQALAYSAQLSSQLDLLQQLAEKRIEVIETISLQQQNLLSNQQEMQQALTYRVRILYSDFDVMRNLMVNADPQLSNLQSLALNTIPLLTVSRFYTTVTTTQAYLLAAPKEMTPAQLNILVQRLNDSMHLAEAIMLDMPQTLASEIAPTFDALNRLAFDDQGLIPLRQEELRLSEQIAQTLETSLDISKKINIATAGLVENSLLTITTAAAEADSTRNFYTILVLVVTGLGIVLVTLIFVFHVDRNVIRELSELSRAMQAISEGRFDISMPRGGHDEIGKLGEAVEQFHDTALRAEKRESELQKVNLQLAKLSRLDGLTGLANRRFFDQQLAEQWQALMTAKAPLSLIMLDIDHFKEYNDVYGHQAGDDCLKKFANLLKRAARRQGELAARYGGEEFCLILPRVPQENAYDIAKQILLQIHELALPHAHADPGIVTASLGVATVVPGPKQRPNRLIRAADKAMYQAKQKGRDQVISHALD